MTPLNFEQVKSILSRVTYRPGWTFVLHGALPTPTDPWLMIDGPVVDANDHTNVTRVGVRVAVPMDFRSESDVMEWLTYCVQRIEMHESREFLRIDGRPWDDPHGRQQFERVS
jgi:hypothetical protein